MKPDFSRKRRVRRAYRRKAEGKCGICMICPAVEGQGHCKSCHALFQRFWRVKRKSRRGLDDDVRMVLLGLELLQRRLGIGIRAWERGAQGLGCMAQ